MMKSNESIQKILILNDIRSAQNVGSLFRTADASGITKIYLVGITPTPIDRFGRQSTLVAKTALGAEKSVPWEYVGEIMPLLEQLKKEGITTIAIEQSDRAQDYKTIHIDTSVACIFGNEVTGLSNDILEYVDIVAAIGMRGMKESLNVAVAGGIALFRFFDS